jgi:hypothetical protein
VGWFIPSILYCAQPDASRNFSANYRATCWAEIDAILAQLEGDEGKKLRAFWAKTKTRLDPGKALRFIRIAFAVMEAAAFYAGIKSLSSWFYTKCETNTCSPLVHQVKRGTNFDTAPVLPASIRERECMVTRGARLKQEICITSLAPSFPGFSLLDSCSITLQKGQLVIVTAAGDIFKFDIHNFKSALLILVSLLVHRNGYSLSDLNANCVSAPGVTALKAYLDDLAGSYSRGPQVDRLGRPIEKVDIIELLTEQSKLNNRLGGLIDAQAWERIKTWARGESIMDTGREKFWGAPGDMASRVAGLETGQPYTSSINTLVVNALMASLGGVMARAQALCGVGIPSSAACKSAIADEYEGGDLPGLASHIASKFKVLPFEFTREHRTSFNEAMAEPMRVLGLTDFPDVVGRAALGDDHYLKLRLRILIPISHDHLMRIWSAYVAACYQSFSCSGFVVPPEDVAKHRWLRMPEPYLYNSTPNTGSTNHLDLRPDERHRLH